VAETKRVRTMSNLSTRAGEDDTQGAGATGFRRRRFCRLERNPVVIVPFITLAASTVSLRTFARRFNEEVGMSPGRWLIQQRVDRAQHLLESTDLAVDDIAGQVGFAGGTSLREHLHAAIGVSPLAYRRTFRGLPAENH
jgi:transcriptional regulator GlxA family with amidase domain